MHYMTADPDAVRAHYKGLRQLAYNNARAAASGAVSRRKAAGQMGRLMRDIELIERCMGKRGESLR